MGVPGSEKRHGAGAAYQSLRSSKKNLYIKQQQQKNASEAELEERGKAPSTRPVLYVLLINATRNTQCWNLGLEFIVLFNVPLLYLAFKIHGQSFILFL